MKKFLISVCVGLCVGATAVAFTAPAVGQAGFHGFCNHGQNRAGKC